MPSPISLLPFLVTAILTRPITAATPPNTPITPIIPGRQVYNCTCPALPPPLRRGDPDSCIDVIFRQLLTLQPASGHGFPFTTNPADAPRPEWTVPFTFPHEIPGLSREAIIPDAMNVSENHSAVVEGAVATSRHRRRRSTTTSNATSIESTKSSQCFVHFDFWDREAGGPGYQHEEGWGMNLVVRYAGAAWDGCLRDQGQDVGVLGRVVPKPASATLRLVIEVLAVELDV